MKRSIFGVGMLGFLLVACLLAQNRMAAAHSPTAKLVEKAGQLALAEDWEGAETAFRQAAQRWQDCRSLTASLADHTPMEDVEGLFAQLEIFAEQQETTQFAALCRELAGRVEAMADAHVMSLWNVL